MAGPPGGAGSGFQLAAICGCTAWPPGAPRRPGRQKRHTQAVIALARRRVNVLWALIRDRRLYEVAPPQATVSP